MTWLPLLPDRPHKGKVAPATITINTASGRFAQRMLLTLRTAEMPGVPAWCKPDAPVSVERGAAEDFGRYRIAPDGPWRLRRSAGQGKSRSVTLKLPPPDGAPREGCRQLAVEFRFDGGRLEIALPKLAHSASAPVRKGVGDGTASGDGRVASGAALPREPAGSAAPLPRGSPGYVGISERVPDPAKAIQAMNGGRVR